MGRKNRRGKNHGGFVKGEYSTRLSDRIQKNGELKPLNYIPCENSSKPHKRNRKNFKNNKPEM